MKVFNLEIVTPEALVFSGQVASVKVPGAEGGFQVLYNHAPIISTLTDGKIVVEKDGGEKIDFHTRGGVIEVLNNKVIVLAEQILS